MCKKVHKFYAILLLTLTGCIHPSNDPLQNPSGLEVRTAEFVLENAGSDTPEESYRRALAYLEKEELENARKELTSELMKRSVDPRYSFVLGKVYYLQGDYQGAQKMLRDALELGFNQPELFRLLSDTYIRLGYTTRALATANRLLELDNTPDNQSLKGKVLLTLGDTASSVELFRQSMKQDSSIRNNYEGLLAVAFARGQSDVAGTLINTYLRRFPDDQAMRMNRASWLMKQQLYPEARDVYVSLMKEDPKNVTYLKQHALSYYQQGRYDSALIQGRRALVMNEEDLSLKIMIARSLENQRLYDEAKESYARILAGDSTVTEAMEGYERLQKRDAYLRYLRNQEEQRSIPPLLEPLKPGTPSDNNQE